MTKSKIFFIIVIGALLGLGVLFHTNMTQNKTSASENIEQVSSKYGNFLAAQHAVYINDFNTASDLMAGVPDTELAPVKDTHILSTFLAGKMPENVNALAKADGAGQRIIYDAYLAQNNKWDDLYKRHNKDKSVLYAPIRIWSAIAIDRRTETLKYIDANITNTSWKHFLRGQVYAETGNKTRAAEEFVHVDTDFMNMNDYLYIMSFYKAHDMDEAAERLHRDFTSRPGGMFLSDNKNIPDWSVFNGTKNALVFNLIQNVSHTQIMLFTDFSVLFLRFAQIIAPENEFYQNAINYYLGQFSFNTNGNYAPQFEKIDTASPFYLFAKMKTIDKKDSVRELKDILQKQPLFIPALNRLVSLYTKDNQKSRALSVINTALKNKNLSEASRAYLIKRRAAIYLTFGDIKRAQADIYGVAKMLPVDRDVLSAQAIIWAAQNREIETAYDYAMAIIKKDPTDVQAWDTLGTVVAVREGNEAALEIFERVSASARTCSSLFEHLGDAYVRAGNKKDAKNAYLRAIELADDGLVVIRNIEKKLRKLK